MQFTSATMLCRSHSAKHRTISMPNRKREREGCHFSFRASWLASRKLDISVIQQDATQSMDVCKNICACLLAVLLKFWLLIKFGFG